ncbi:MAG TPA: tRNA-binding protein [Candidatus Binatus sp.]|nr:tRNA-binding protein [Candidatus Binatus sp.]
MNQITESGSSISFSDFLKVDIRSGTITGVVDFPRANKPAYRLWIDFGPLGTKASSAQVTTVYKKEELIGRQVLAVVNFPPKQVANFVSEVLVLGLPNREGDVVLVQPERAVPNGARLF